MCFWFSYPGFFLFHFDIENVEIIKDVIRIEIQMFLFSCSLLAFRFVWIIWRFTKGLKNERVFQTRLIWQCICTRYCSCLGHWSFSTCHFIFCSTFVTAITLSSKGLIWWANLQNSRVKYIHIFRWHSVRPFGNWRKILTRKAMGCGMAF